MKVCYIPAIVATTTDKGIVEKAISDAINSTIVTPIKAWALDTWIRVIDLSGILCLAIAFTGAICGMLGIKKGYKATVLSIVFYCLIRLFSYLMGWY
ncbi:MAG: hypothetical protein AB9856_20960 [Cellulosilyticaceae bacterium]